MAAKAYTASGDFTEVTITKTRRGWLIERHLRIIGETTSTRVFVPFGGDFPRDVDLYADWNDYMSFGSALMSRSEDCRKEIEALRYYHARVLSRGYLVE